MRLIHTADIHLDRSFADGSLPRGTGNRRRQRLRDVFNDIIERCLAWPADALLIAGDLFEGDRVSHDTIAFVRQGFERLRKIPVFIAPGNHDPYTPDSAYATESWPANVTIFVRPRWEMVEVEHIPLTVHGFAFDGPDISHNPFGELTIPDDGRVHVALGHGSERKHQPAGKEAYAAFDAASAAPQGLRYLALGHFHRMTPIDGAFQTRIYYSGAPEGHGFGDSGERCFLEVEIEGDDIIVTPRPSSRTLYVSEQIDVSTFTTTQQIVEALRALPRRNGVAVFARVGLTGTCPAALRAEFRALPDALRDQFEHLAVLDDTLPAEDYDELARENTSLGGFIRKINEEIESTKDDARRAVLLRARDVGLAAYRGIELPLNGSEDA